MMANFGEIATVGAAARADCNFGTLGRRTSLAGRWYGDVGPQGMSFTEIAH